MAVTCFDEVKFQFGKASRGGRTKAGGQRRAILSQAKMLQHPYVHWEYPR
jgi:hypothetical protein